MTGEGCTTSPLLLGSELARDDAEGSGECSASCHKRLVHLVVNAILYAASYSHAWPALVSPVKALRSSAKGMGDQGRQRIEKRALELASNPFRGRRLSPSRQDHYLAAANAAADGEE